MTEMSKLGPEGIQGIMDAYAGAEKKKLHELHPVEPRVEFHLEGGFQPAGDQPHGVRVYSLSRIKKALDYISKQIEGWKARRSARLYQARVRLFHELMKREDSGVPQMVKALVTTQALALFGQLMKKRGIAHCQFCLSTDQLRKHGPGYICGAHHAALQKQQNQPVDRSPQTAATPAIIK